LYSASVHSFSGPDGKPGYGPLQAMEI